MPRHCAVLGCKPRRLKKKRFTIPKDPVRRKKWEDALGQNLCENQIICCQHFREEDILTQKVFKDKDGKILGSAPLLVARLAPDAVPCFVPNDVKLEAQVVSKATKCEDDQQSNEEEEIIMIVEETRNIRKIPKTVINTTIEEENHPLFDSLLFQISLPQYWSRIIPFNNTNCITFACFFQEDSCSSITPFKEVCVFRNGDIVYRFNGQRVDTSLSPKLSTVESLENDIENFDTDSC